VSRRPDPQDRRVVLVAIRPAGRAVVEAVMPQIRQLAARLRAVCGTEALEELEARLKSLIALAPGGED